MRRNNSVGYYSSYDRGLECLLKMWPAIRLQVPDANLSVYYGWQTFDSFHRSNPQMMAWRWHMTRTMHQLREQGVTEHGRVDHLTLAKAMQETKVWAYPTEFAEINCITALKAQEAGMIPVTTLVAALDETVRDQRFCVRTDDIYTNTAHQEKFIEQVIAAFAEDEPSRPVPGVDWSDIAKEWTKVCESDQLPAPITKTA